MIEGFATNYKIHDQFFIGIQTAVLIVHIHWFQSVLAIPFLKPPLLLQRK